jgi:hypothetical protein
MLRPNFCGIRVKQQQEGVSDLALPLSEPGVWDILCQFASSDMTLPQAKEHLLYLLGTCYRDEDWHPALNAVMDTEGDIIMAQEAIQNISVICKQPKLTIKLPAPCQPLKLATIEDNLMGSVQDLWKWNCIFGELPSIDDLVNLAQEQLEEIEDSPYVFPGDKDIVNQVIHDQQGEIIDVDNGDEEEEEDPDMDITCCDAIRLVATLEQLTIKCGGDETQIANTLELNHQLWKFHTFLNSRCHQSWAADLQKLQFQAVAANVTLHKILTCTCDICTYICLLYQCHHKTCITKPLRVRLYMVIDVEASFEQN